MMERHGWKILAMALLLSPCRPSIAEEPQSNAQSISWLEDYSDARRKGMDTERPVLLYVTTDGCHYCDKMQSLTFSDHQVMKNLNDQFVTAKVQLLADSELGKQLMITIYPTTIIISPEGKILDYVRGYLDPVSLQRRMSDAIGVHQSIASRE